MAFVFWTSLILVGYTYLGYPLAMALLAKLRPMPRRHVLSGHALPEVTVVIAAWNEAHYLSRKIQSILASVYPRNKIKIIVASDGSTDDTAAVVANFPGTSLVQLAQRQGKPAAINAAMQSVDTEFVVCTDARQTLAKDAIARLITVLVEDPRVGAVSGELVQLDATTGESISVGMYWKYEKWIRANESRIHSVPGVSGALYAMRHGDFQPLHHDTILDDFEIPIAMLRNGKKIKFESGAKMYDRVEQDSSDEQRRKIRTLLGNYQSFSRNPWLFNPVVNPIWVQFISHKVMRLLVPYWMVSLMITPLFLTGTVYQLFFLAESGFYAVVVLGKWVPATRKNKLIAFCNVFWDMNFSVLIALKRYLTGEFDVRWQKRIVSGP